MKLFSEFGSCWGGAVFSTGAEAAVVGQQTEEQGRCRHRHGHRTSKRLVKVRPGGTTNWKPKLNVISENSPMPEGGENRRSAGIDNKKAVKVKPRSPAPLNHGEDYSKSSPAAMALPTFSPTSFLF